MVAARKGKKKITHYVHSFSLKAKIVLKLKKIG